MATSDSDNSYYLGLISEASLKLDAEGLAEPNPTPEVILLIRDSESRHHYEVCWRNVSRLKNLLLQWGIWHIGLKWRGNADWSVTDRLKKATRACIIALHNRGWDMEEATRIWNALPTVGPPRPLAVEHEMSTEFSRNEAQRLNKWLSEHHDNAREKTAEIVEGKAFLQLRRDLADGLLLLEADAPQVGAGRPKSTNSKKVAKTDDNAIDREIRDRLDTRDRHFLRAALQLKATNKDERRSAREIGRKADPSLTENQVKTIATKLRRLGYLESFGKGRGKAYFLTVFGKAEAEKPAMEVGR